MILDKNGANYSDGKEDKSVDILKKINKERSLTTKIKNKGKYPISVTLHILK